MKKDLSEFSDVVANEANAIANTTLESVKHQAHTFQQMVSVDEEDSTLTAPEKPLSETVDPSIAYSLFHFDQFWTKAS